MLLKICWTPVGVGWDRAQGPLVLPSPGWFNPGHCCQCSGFLLGVRCWWSLKDRALPEQCGCGVYLEDWVLTRCCHCCAHGSGKSLTSCLSILLPGEQDWVIPECIPSPLAWGTHMNFPQDCPGAAAISS